MYLLTRNMFEVSNLRHTEAGEVVLGSEQVGDFLPPAFGHRVQGALAGQDQPEIDFCHITRLQSVSQLIGKPRPGRGAVARVFVLRARMTPLKLSLTRGRKGYLATHPVLPVPDSLT